MSIQERLRDLVKEWVRSANAGKPIPLAELCQEAPELLPQVREQVDQLIAKAKEKKRAASEPQVKVDTGTYPGAPPVEGTCVQDGPPSVSVASSDGYPNELGGYRLTKILGEGGMGRVYLADDPRLGRQIAVKVMRPDVAMSSESRERFLREARATAKLNHDHIITIFQVGEENQIPFLVMPLLEGEPLDARLKREGKQTVKEAVRIAREMAEGLASAHEKGLIHRDIKPANIWLEASPGRKSGESRVKILDFGLAKENLARDGEGGLTQSGAIMGTPAYMSPEQARGLPVDGRSDLFSLGGVLYQMLTGKRPFTGSDTMAILTSLAVDTPTEPVQLDHLCPPVLSQLTMRLLAKNPDGRPASAQILVDELVKFEQDCHAATGIVSLSAMTPVIDPWVGINDEETENRTPLSLKVVPPSEKTLATAGKSKTPLFMALGLLALLPILWLASTIIRVETPDGTLLNKLPEKQKTEVVKNDPQVNPKVVPPIPKPQGEPKILDCTGPNGASAAMVKKSQQEWADYLGVKVTETVDLGGSIKIEFMLVPPGKFMMGGTKAEQEVYMESYKNEKRPEWLDWELPQHEVTITKPFFLGKYEVTQEEYTTLTGLANPSSFKNEANAKRHPVENVSWDDAKVAWEKLTAKNLPKGFTRASLPTEAQWEYACRGGTRTAFHFGDVLNGTEANYYGNIGKPTPVGNYKPNAFGLFDMHGNVWEWCWDGWDEKAYKSEGRIDPFVEHSDNHRCLRGGSWGGNSRHCRAASRNGSNADYRGNEGLGFRVVLPLD